MKLAILGAAGMLGHTLYQVLAERFPDTWAVVRKPAAHYARYGLFDAERIVDGFEARDAGAVRGVLDRLQPDVVLNAVGLTTRKLGGQRASDVIAVNAVLPHVLKEWGVENGRRLIHFSTDCVFSGAAGPYAEDHPRDAKDLYGQSKALGEVEGEGVLTIRSSIIGLELEGDTELLEWVRKQRGAHIQGYRRVMYSGVTTRTMAEVVRTLLVQGVSFGGIRQLASEPISKYALVTLASELLGVGAVVEPVDHPSSNKVLLPSPFFDAPGLRPASWRDQLAAVAGDVPTHDSWKHA